MNSSKKIVTRYILAFALLMSMLSTNSYAIDMATAANSYYQLQEQLAKAAQNEANITSVKVARSTSRIVVQGIVVSGLNGSQIVSNDSVSGPVSRAGVHSFMTPLYENNEFGLYLFQGLWAQVWYVGDYASVLLITAYSDF